MNSNLNRRRIFRYKNSKRNRCQIVEKHTHMWFTATEWLERREEDPDIFYTALRFSDSCHRHHSSNRHSQALSTTDSKINYKIYNYPPYTNKYYLKNETTTMRLELIFVGSNSHQVNSPYEFCVRKPICGTLDGLTLHVGLTRGFTQVTRNKRDFSR